MFSIVVIRIVMGDPFGKKTNRTESVWFVLGHHVKVLMLSDEYG